MTLTDALLVSLHVTVTVVCCSWFVSLTMSSSKWLMLRRSSWIRKLVSSCRRLIRRREIQQMRNSGVLRASALAAGGWFGCDSCTAPHQQLLTDQITFLFMCENHIFWSYLIFQNYSLMKNNKSLPENWQNFCNIAHYYFELCTI